MPQQPSTTPDARLTAAATALASGPVLEAVNAAAEELRADFPEVPVKVLAAALADSLRTALREPTRTLIIEAQAGPGGSTARARVAELLGITRQGVERRFGLTGSRKPVTAV